MLRVPRTVTFASPATMQQQIDWMKAVLGHRQGQLSACHVLPESTRHKIQATSAIVVPLGQRLPEAVEIVLLARAENMLA